MDPDFASLHAIYAHPALANLRCVNRSTLEHAGPCPYCGGNGRRSDRFRVWLAPGEERFWCRSCNEKGPLRKLIGEAQPQVHRIAVSQSRSWQRATPPNPAHQRHYRELYMAVALWANENLLDLCNPDPIDYLRGRGLDDTTIKHNLLGVTRRDPGVLVDFLRTHYPALLPYAEEAGILVSDGNTLRAHPNLCGCIVFPYIAGTDIVDLRTRTYPGKGYRSLGGGYTERGATTLFGWNQLGNTDTVLITEGEIKALIATQFYTAGQLSAPAIAHPGLSYLREEWGAVLLGRGVRTVVLAYDSQPRPVKDGCLHLAPEEIWTIRHGQTLENAGLDVQVLRLPLAQGETKADLDEFILTHGPARLQHLIDTAPSLADYHRSLPRHLLQQAKLPLATSYPTRRARPQRLEAVTPHPIDPKPSLTLADARDQIAGLVADHASSGQGMLVLAHPPGTGKGHNTTAGLKHYLQTAETPGQIVWTALRKEQIHDQTGLDLIPLHGRNQGNCRKFGEAQALSRHGYSVRQTLCQRRCPHVSSCAYLRQFGVEADFFAPQPLLQATSWWQNAAVVVLDEFDPARLTRIVPLDSADLARMAQHADDPHAQTLLRWLSTILGSATDRAITGALLLTELEVQAHLDSLDLETTLLSALGALPNDEEVAMLPGLSRGATLTDYEALPVNYLGTIIAILVGEYRRYRAGQAFTSRLELRNGRLWLYLRADHLIAQLARPEQPKILLDATVNETLLRAIFPGTPIQIERPRVAGGATVVQIINRDWAKTTLRGQRREQWYDAVAAQIRPGRPTLVVCTMACEADLRAALADRGHSDVCVAHYGALRGSNAYKSFDVILAQVYHPNLDAVVQEGRALFAGEGEPLDERTIVTERTLTDASGASWVVQVPTFADERLAALLEQRRESELVQAALRGRPFDHPEAQITLLFGLPLPQLPPTQVVETEGSATSNAGREATARDRLANATRDLLDSGKRVVSVDDLAEATGQSVVTVRRHLAAIAGRLRLRLIQQRRMVSLPQGGRRAYERAVLVRRGRWAPPTVASDQNTVQADSTECTGIDQARNTYPITRVINPSRPGQRGRRYRGASSQTAHRLSRQQRNSGRRRHETYQDEPRE